MNHLPALGATPIDENRTRFCVWAPNCQQVDVKLFASSSQELPGDESEARIIRLQRDVDGYHSGELEDVGPGARYSYLLDGETERPDPVSRFQPEGVHGPSVVVDPGAFPWSDDTWPGRALEEYIIYELHVGTFSQEGTFDGVIQYLDDLVDLGITSVEIMPVAQFPGNRNWGYDGVSLFAVQDSYGGPDGLRRLVDACHERGLAIILDVVYNHLGPEGNYLRDFGPYFTDHYQTPWGEALNFDGPGSDHVRHFFLENARYWLREFHFDGFRLDAVHAIYDTSATPFLEELATLVHSEGERAGRRTVVIAESDLNDPKVIRSPELGGWGHDAQWADDLHHSLHALLTGEQDGYYVDYGSPQHLVDTLRQGYMFTGQYSDYRQRSHGRWPGIADGRRFVVCSQNHDQVGNRATGDRLTANLEFEQLKLVAGITILSPFLPMLFMGEEYADPAPFQYFVSHGDPDLVKAVQEGRRKEFESFNWQASVPDPQAESTFERSKLDHNLKATEPHSFMFDWYRELIALRQTLPALRNLDLSQQDVWTLPGTSVIVIRRKAAGHECLILVNFLRHAEKIKLELPALDWKPVLNSLSSDWDGPGEDVPALTLDQGTAELTLPGQAFFVYEGAYHSR